MSIQTAYSTRSDVQEAVQEIQNDLIDTSPSVVLFFASPQLDPDRTGSLMQAAFPDATVLGCTTAGELVSGAKRNPTGAMLKQAIVAMAFDASVIADAAVQVVDLDAADGVDAAFAGFEAHYGVAARDLNPSGYVGLLLIDGLSGAEERINDRVGDLTNVQFVGGSAGDDLKFEVTYLFANGQRYTNAAVLAILKPTVAFDVIKTQSFDVLDTVLTPTAVNAGTREVLSFNNQPAAYAYANALDCTVEEAAERFMLHPVGLMVGAEPFVRSPQRLNGEHMVFYCNVHEGMPLQLLKSRDIVSDTQHALTEAANRLGGFSGLINFHCILRTLELQNKAQTDAYGDVFSEHPMVGFSTYGESYIGHINQTATILAFGKQPL